MCTVAGYAGPVTKPVRMTLALAGLLFVGTVLSWSSYVPIYDGRIYADCAVAAAEHFSFEALRCGLHNSQAYSLLLTLTQLPAPGHFPPMLVMNAALGLLALAALYRIGRAILPSPDAALEVAAACLAFAANPLFLTSAVQINVDYGVLVFFLGLLASLLEGRLVAAAGFGVMLEFSKETGIALHALAVGLYLFFFVFRGPESRREKLAKLWRHLVLLAPLVLAVAYVGWRRLDPSRAAMWKVESTSDHLFDDLVSFRANDPIFLTAVAGIFLIHFLWVPSSLILAEAARLGWRWLWGEPVAPTPGADDRRAWFVTVLGAVMTLALTRFRTFTNLRYYLPLYPMVMCLFLLAMRRLQLRSSIRLALLVVLAVSLYASTFRSLDPVSRLVFGTFTFGSHEMLSLTRNTGECCGGGRDQLAYNLEFTVIHDLEDQVLAALPDVENETLVVDPRADWYVMGAVDSRTHRRTLATSGVVQLRHVDATTLGKMSPLPARIRYLAWPNIEDGLTPTALRSRYDLVSEQEFSHDGYALPVITLQLRPAGAPEPTAEPRQP